MPRLSFANVASGWHPFAPARSLRPDQGPCWRHLQSLRWHDGSLEFRRSVRQPDGTVTQPPICYSLASQVEIPLYIFQALTGDVVAASSTQSEVGTILVTTTDIYAHQDSGWAVLTPVYDTGTISATAGNATISGVGTAWATRVIGPGQKILVGAEWLRIVTVATDTSMTVTPAPSANHSGAYEIRRSFNYTIPVSGTNYFTPRAAIYAVMHNGDLYVAGTSLAGFQVPAVVRVEDPFGAAPFTTYLTSNFDLTGSLDAIGAMTAITGLDVLQDGRVLLAVTEGGHRASRLRYSSLTDQAVWSVAPGGFVDVVSGGKGAITTLGRMGGNTTIHYADGIAIGYPTGQDDPPLDIRSTRARFGCVGHRTLRVANGAEMYLDAQGSVRAFDGSLDSLVSNDFRGVLKSHPLNKVGWINHGYLDPYRNEYQVFVLDPPETANSTYCFSVDLAGGGTRQEHYNYTITAIADEVLASPGLALPIPTGDRQEAAAIIGVTASLTTKAPFAILRESFGADDAAVQTAGGGTAQPVRAESDALDFGVPQKLKVPQRVVVRMRKPAASVGSATQDTITVSLSPDGGSSYPAAMQDTKTFTFSAAGDDDTQTFHFASLSALTWKVRLQPSVNTALVGAFEWIDFDVEVLGDEPAVP